MALSDLGRNLRRFMKLKNVSIPKLATDSNLGTATLSNILNNKTSPSVATIEKIANALKIPTDELFTDIPKLTTLKYRTNKISARELPELELLKTNIAFWLQDYSRLEEQLKKSIPFKLSNIKEKDPKEAAKIVRTFFHDSYDIPENAPLVDLIQIIETSGIKLNILPFGFKQTFGMSVGEIDKGPAIIINDDSSLSAERKRFTLAHELGHLILHSTLYEEPDFIEDDKMEREADIFAAELLMPTKAFIKKWNDFYCLNFVDSILTIKQYFGVSYQTVLHRLTDLTGKKDLYKTFCIGYKRQTGHDLKNHYEPYTSDKEIFKMQQEVFKSTRFDYLIVQACNTGIISKEEAANISNKSLDEIEENLNGDKICRMLQFSEQ